jgi:hypothetical protein
MELETVLQAKAGISTGAWSSLSKKAAFIKSWLVIKL